MEGKKFLAWGMMVFLGFSPVYIVAAAEPHKKFTQPELDTIKREVCEAYKAGDMQGAFDKTKQLRVMHGATEADLLKELFEAIMNTPGLSEEAEAIAWAIIARFRDKLDDPKVQLRRAEYEKLFDTFQVNLIKKVSKREATVASKEKGMNPLSPEQQKQQKLLEDKCGKLGLQFFDLQDNAGVAKEAGRAVDVKDVTKFIDAGFNAVDEAKQLMNKPETIRQADAIIDHWLNGVQQYANFIAKLAPAAKERDRLDSEIRDIVANHGRKNGLDGQYNAGGEKSWHIVNVPVVLNQPRRENIAGMPVFIQPMPALSQYYPESDDITNYCGYYSIYHAIKAANNGPLPYYATNMDKGLTRVEFAQEFTKMLGYAKDHHMNVDYRYANIDEEQVKTILQKVYHQDLPIIDFQTVDLIKNEMVQQFFAAKQGKLAMIYAVGSMPEQLTEKQLQAGAQAYGTTFQQSHWVAIVAQWLGTAQGHNIALQLNIYDSLLGNWQGDEMVEQLRALVQAYLL
jgi:hypothetical protein